MFKLFKTHLHQWQETIIVATSITGFVLLGYFMGMFQLLEWETLDLFFRVRTAEPEEPRIVVVTIDESDIEEFGHPFSDQLLSQLIQQIQLQKPTLIGLDLYRNVPVEPGHQALQEVFRTTPNLIGVEKNPPNAVPPPPILEEQKQVALADLIHDRDGTIRRGFISMPMEVEDVQPPTLKWSFGTMIALSYLEKQGITAKAIANRPYEYQLGKLHLQPLQENDGAYIRAKTRGYQFLINFRGASKFSKTSEDLSELSAPFETISMQDVVNGHVPTESFTNRIVLIGVIAESLNDNYKTPYQTLMPGVMIHANIISQIISGAMEGRQWIQSWPEPAEWLWIWGWSILGISISRKVLERLSLKSNLFTSFFWILLGICGSGVGLIMISFALFLGGIWIPTITPLVALMTSSLAISIYKAQQSIRLASLDGLTQVANRRYFDEKLHSAWYKRVGSQEYMAIILCDVDFFKPYNDTYGHQAGDQCLQQVAFALTQSVRSEDLVARYGGEEFVVILANAHGETAVKVAERIRRQVQQLKLPHTGSTVSQYVSLSCGVASVIPDEFSSPASLVADADKALYKAKNQGRNRVVLF